MGKKLILTTFCVFMAMCIPVFAQTDKEAAPAASGHESHAGQDTAKSTPPPVAAKPPAHDHDMGKDAQMMDEHMKKMRSQMEKIRATTDPAERQKLMQEHKASMREGMKMMKGMPGCRMMAGSVKSGEPGKMVMKPMGMGSMMCHQMMEKKMEMMQDMMEGLIDASQMNKH